MAPIRRQKWSSTRNNYLLGGPMFDICLPLPRILSIFKVLSVHSQSRKAAIGSRILQASWTFNNASRPTGKKSQLLALALKSEL